MKASLLQRHLKKKYGSLQNKTVVLFQWRERDLVNNKRKTKSSSTLNEGTVESSFKDSLKIAHDCEKIDFSNCEGCCFLNPGRIRC